MTRKIFIVIFSLLLAAAITAIAAILLYDGLKMTKLEPSIDSTDSPSSGDIGNSGIGGGTLGDTDNSGSTVTPGGVGGSTGGGIGSTGGSTGGTAAPHVCSYKLTKTVPADCGHQGYDLYTCSVANCGNTTQNNFKPIVGTHKFKNVVHYATCKTDWYQQDECEICGAVDSSTVIVVPDSKVDHDYAWTTTKQADCEHSGEKQGRCNWCGAAKADIVPALKHDFATYNSNGDMTCTLDGTETAECTRCGEVDTRTAVGSRLGHEYSEYVSNNDRTCVKDGTLSAECERCHTKLTIKDEKNLAGHSYGNYVVTTAKSCTQDEISTATCKDCGNETTKVTAKASHNYSNTWTIVTDATCQKEGYKTHKCQDCGEVSGVTIAKTDHDFSSDVCPMCGTALQSGNAMFAVDVKKSDGTAFSDYGTVYLQFIVNSVEKVVYDSYNWGYEADFSLYVVQTYTVNGEPKTVRTKATLDLDKSGLAGSVTVKVLNIKTGNYVDFSGWIDTSVYFDESRLRFVTDICDGNAFTADYDVHFEGSFMMKYYS